MTATEPAAGWYPVEQEPSPRRRRKQALADRVRELVEDVLYLDCEAADEHALRQAERALAEARAAVRSTAGLRAGGGLYASDGDISLFQRSPFSGRCNALAAPLSMHFSGDRTYACATYGAAYEGPPGSVHGGHVMAAFDDLLGVAQAASGRPGLTGTLTVRMVTRTPLHERIDYEAGVESVEGRKVRAWGRSTLRGELLAEANGIFITPRQGLDLPVPTEIR